MTPARPAPAALHVEPAGPDDAAALAALHAASFDAPWSEASLRALLHAPGALALRAGDDGFILLRRVLDEAEVLTLAVRPAARRRGLGAALAEAAALALAQDGAAVLHLEVAADNAAALALYAATGFAPTGRRRGYYARGAGAPPVDALLMTRRLNRPAA